MSAPISATRQELSPIEAPNSQNTDKNGRWHTIGKIALKALAISAIVLGSAAALAGAVVVTKLVVATGILAPLLVPCVVAAASVMEFTFLLLKHDSTALGAMFTVPLAGVCLAPFLLPIAIGAAPGAGLIGLGAWGWSALS